MRRIISFFLLIIGYIKVSDTYTRTSILRESDGGKCYFDDVVPRLPYFTLLYFTLLKVGNEKIVLSILGPTNGARNVRLAVPA